MKRVVFVFGHERGTRFRMYQAGHGPGEFMYGFVELDETRYRKMYIERDMKAWNIQRFLWQPFEAMITKQFKIGFALGTILKNFSQLRQADVIVSTVDTMGLPIAAMKHVGILSTPLLYMSQGLTDRLDLLTKSPRRLQLITTFVRACLRAVERIIVLGEGAIPPLIKLSQSPAKVFSVPFGVDAKFWVPTISPMADDFILSVGSDPARDYTTLLQAITSQDQLQIVTRLPIRNIPSGGHVRVGSNFTDEELRTLYQQARCVVIPLKDVAQPSGQSATLQAMACGKAVILSRIRGLWDPDMMRHMENCYLVPPDNPQALQEAISFFREHPDQAQSIGHAARRTVEDHYTTYHFAQNLEKHIRVLLEKSGPR